MKPGTDLGRAGLSCSGLHELRDGPQGVVIRLQARAGHVAARSSYRNDLGTLLARRVERHRLPGEDLAFGVHHLD
jgi:hypothetical protein